MKRRWLAAGLALAALAGADALAQERRGGPQEEAPGVLELLREREHLREQDRVFGYQLLSDREIAEHRARMSAARSEAERERIRAEHRERVERRLQELERTIGDIRRRGARGPGAGRMDGAAGARGGGGQGPRKGN